LQRIYDQKTKWLFFGTLYITLESATKREDDNGPNQRRGLETGMNFKNKTSLKLI